MADEPEMTTEDRRERIEVLVDDHNFAVASEVFRALHPADQSDVLADLDHEAKQALLAALTPEEAGHVIEQLEPTEAAELYENVGAAELAQVLDAVTPDVAADVLKQLPMGLSQEALEAMLESEEVAPLLAYSDDTAGGIMTPEVLSVGEDMTAAAALDVLRLNEAQVEDAGAIFVVGDGDRLTGALRVVRLALARQNAWVRDIMTTDIISVPAEMDQEECARLIERYDLAELPVVDEAGRLIGVILAEDAADVAEEEATEDMYRIAGLGDERLRGALSASVRSRFPWLAVNLLTTFLAALVISFFESTIVKVVALAVFLPVVAGQGGIAGTQTLTLAVRSMALGELSGRRGRRLLVREVTLGLLHGLLLGIAVGIVAFVWKGNFFLGLVLGIAMLGNMVIAGVMGAGAPLLLRRLGLDPAVAAAVVVTTITDVVGFLLFLGLAAALVNLLV
jgi:magnesium transporter